MVKESSSFGELHNRLFYVALFAILLSGSFLAPFQEDAFITFRTAQNLAFHREFTYNLGMHYPSATSPLFGYFVAFLYIVAPPAVEMVLRILSCLAVAVGLILIPIFFRVPHNLRQTTILTTALLPVTLYVAGNGMETAFVFLSIVVMFYVGCNGKSGYASGIIFLLAPSLRIDVIPLEVCALYFAYKHNRPVFKWVAGGLIGGIFFVLVMNHQAFGSWLPHSVVAKSYAYSYRRNFATYADTIKNLYKYSYYLSPITGSYILSRFFVLPIATLILAFGQAFQLAGRERSVAVVVLVAALLSPFPYILGGQIFFWYLAPLAIVTQMLAVWRFLTYVCSPNPMFTARVSAIALLAGIVISFAVAGSRLGVREDKFRKSVGEYLATIAEPGQTLFLEPAGRIPFYSGIETVYDEIGLTNPDILPYLKKDPLRAWIGFLKVNRADLLVQRDGILVNQTWQGYELTPDEARWFWGHYEVIKKFNYSDVGGEDWWSNFALLPGESDYVVLRKRTDSDSDLNSTVH